MNIIKSELYKLKKSKSFCICLSICVAFAAFMAYAIQLGVSRGDGEFVGMGHSGVEMIGHSLSINIHQIFLAMFISIFVSSEFHNGTMKNYISKGVNRVGMYLSKLAVCGVAALTMFAGYYCICLYHRYNPLGL